MKFQDDISNMNTYKHTHTYGQAETNMSPFFSKLGHKNSIFPTLNDDSAAHCPARKKVLFLIVFFLFTHRYATD